MGYNQDDDFLGDSRLRGQSLPNARVKVYSFGEPLSLVDRLERHDPDLYAEPVIKGKSNRLRDLRPTADAKPYIPSYQRQVAQLNKGAPHKNQLWQLEAKRRMVVAQDPERIARLAQTAGHSMQARSVPVLSTSDLLPVKRPKPKVVRSFKNAPAVKNGADIPNPGVCKYVG